MEKDKTVWIIVGFVALAIVFAVLPLLWHGPQHQGSRPLIGEVVTAESEQITLRLHKGKTVTLFMADTLSDEEKMFLIPGAKVEVWLDAVVDAEPTIEKVRLIKMP